MKNNIFENKIIKVLTYIIILFIGTVAGVYTGYALIGNNQQPVIYPVTFENPPISKEEMLSFGEGDLFPHDYFSYLDGTQENFETLLKKKSIIIFSSVVCGVCDEFFEYWNKAIKPNLLPNVQVIVCLSDDNMKDNVNYQLAYPDCLVVSVEPKYYLEKYNFNIRPTIIAVDEFGFVQGIHYGFSMYINKKILKDFTTLEID